MKMILVMTVLSVISKIATQAIYEDTNKCSEKPSEMQTMQNHHLWDIKKLEKMIIDMKEEHKKEMLKLQKMRNGQDALSELQKIKEQQDQDRRNFESVISGMKYNHEKEIHEMRMKYNDQDTVILSQNKTLQSLIEKLNELEDGSSSPDVRSAIKTLEKKHDQYMKKVENMTIDMENQSKEIQTLWSTFKQQNVKSDIQTLETKHDQDMKKMENMTTEMENQSKEIQKLWSSLKQQNPVIYSRNVTLKVNDLEQKNDLENASNSKDPLTTATSPAQTYIAFYAIATSDQSSGIVVFDRVITNIGGSYNSSTGIFSVGTGGVYVFSWNVETISMFTATVLEVNGVRKGTTSADEESGYKYDTSTSFAVFELNVGDRVNIRVNSGRAVSGGTAFSGWRCSGSLQDQSSAAFYATMSFNSRSKPFKFDNAYTNMGSVYSPSNGTFTAKSPGLYIFTTSLSDHDDSSWTHSFLYIKNVKGYKITINSFKGHYDTTATMTLAYLDKGDQVYVSGESASATSMFAGWLAASGLQSNYPAFTATLSKDSGSTPLVFDDSHVNPHNGYSVSTGKFTAAKPGVYVFFWNIRADDGLVLSRLRVNSRDLGGTRAEGRSSADFDDSSSVAVVQLDSRDQVYVHMIYGTADEDQSTFCGWLLYEY